MNMKTVLISVYIFFGFSAIAFGQIVPDLLALGVKSELANIFDVFLTTTVTAVGAIALYVGIQVPEIPKREPPA